MAGQRQISPTGGVTGSITGSASRPNVGGSVLGGAASGAGTGATIGSVVPGLGTATGAIVGAGIGAVSSLIGAKKGSDASKDASRMQERLAREALAEQKRIYDLEAAKEERNRQKTIADERGVMASRAGAFGSFGGDLSGLSKGYAPAYGMSAEQSDALMAQRNASFPETTMSPQQGKGMPPMSGPGEVPAPWMPRPGGSMGSMVWLQAPTGETRQIPLDQARAYLQRGAKLIPAPTTGGR